MTTSLIVAASAGAILLLTSCSNAALGDPVVRDGTTYTPRAIDGHGCILYSVSRTDGAVPAAMVYRGRDGEFSYSLPQECVEPTSRASSSG